MRDRQVAVPLRVLLISPVKGVDPPSGDVTYTQQLLAHPPPGVAYTTYDQALADGTLVEIGTRGAIRQTHGWEGLANVAAAIARKAERFLRRTGAAYREQIRVFRVRPGHFDLVHVHVFHHRFVGHHPPVVASAGGPLRWVYGDAWGWGPSRLWFADTVDRILGAAWDATMCGSRLGRARLFISPSENLRGWLTSRGWATEQIVVQPNYLARRATARKARSGPVTLGFVARDFDTKGGAEALAAFRALREGRPDLRLLVVGSQPRLSPAELLESGIRWIPEIHRQKLLDDVLPEIDVLVYPSRFDTGVPYSAMEALSFGIPAVVSDYRALPDLIGEGAGRAVPVTREALVAAIEELMAANDLDRASQAARRRFTDHFAAASQAPRLRAVYDRALQDAEVGP